MATFLGRVIEEQVSFKESGRFAAMYAAEGWLLERGYAYGSLDYPRPVGVVKGDYNLPQKWHNINKEQRKSLAGVIFSTDFRHGEVIVYIFKQ